MSITKKEKQLLDSHREILWIKRQIEQFELEEKANLEAHKYIIPEDATEEHVEESIQETKLKVDELKSNYDMLCQFNNSKYALAKSANNQYFTSEAIYPKLTDYHHMEIKKTTERQIDQRDAYMVQFVKTSVELNRKKAQLTEIQQKILRQHEKNADISSKVDNWRSDKSKRDVNHEAVELLKAMNAKKKQISLVRGVLNAVILESSVGWEESERWSNTMFRIGETLPTF